MASNFEFMAKYWPDIAQLGKTAELYLYVDANASVFKVGLLAERIVQKTCAIEKIVLPEQASAADRLRALKYADLLPKRIDDIFYTIRKARNDAVHSGLNSETQAKTLLHMAFSLCCWFMEVYGEWDFAAPAFQLPTRPAQTTDMEALLRAQEERINALPEVTEEPCTAASEAPKEARTSKAEQAAKDLPLSVEESSCIREDPLRVDITALPVINYAMQHNGIPVIRKISIENTTDTAIEDVLLQIESTPAFALPYSLHIDRLPEHEVTVVNCPKLILNSEYLAGMTEKVVGLLRVSLQSGEQTLFSDCMETSVLSFDEWPGIGLFPELLAAFVTPNHPALARIIATAADHLREWSGDASMDAYLSKNPNRVMLQAAAIFTAVKEQAIAYIVPPASFERAGQRVRLADTVLQQKLGTCLDLTLLYASCLEAIGLHPLLITKPGHIFSGVWLEDKMFPECVQDDAAVITKRLAAGVNEIAVVETTCVTLGHNSSFDDARASGEQNLSTRDIEYIIDVCRARQSHILPLPQRVQTASGFEIRHDTTFSEASMRAPAELHEISTTPSDAEGQAEDIPKKVQWERKLLDLGLRNTLINLRITRTQLPILTNSLDALEDALADGSDFSILPKPADLHLETLSFEAIRKLGTDDVIKAEFANKRIRSVLSEGELAKSVKELYRTARTAIEENGANTLYLALGALRWYEGERSAKARYAPIVLLPIEMVRKSAALGYVIRLRDEEPQMNITLLEKLKQDFGIVVQGVNPLPCDEHGVDIRKVLTILRKAVMEQPRWDVLETACIGIYSFSQFVMWNDIHNRADDLLQNKIVRSLIEGKLCWDAKPLEIGAHVSEDDVLLPMPADASQLYAIKAACADESFVLHGPPGTGKSQTITSLIANALAKGKTVLFVAEKMAALEVVQKRLESIGLDPFCLELHSNKSKKKDVLEQLRIATEVTKTQSAESYDTKAKQLAAMRGELDGYVRKLYTVLPCGSHLYALINAYEDCKDAPDIAAFDSAFIHSVNKPEIDKQTLTIERLLAAAGAVGHPHAHPLRRVTCTQYTQAKRNGAQNAADVYEGLLTALRAPLKQLVAALGEPMPATFDAFERLVTIAENISCWYGLPPAWAKADNPQRYLANARAYAEHQASVDACKNKLLQTFEPQILAEDGQARYNEFMQASAKWFLPKALDMRKLGKRLGVYAKAPLEKDKLREYIETLRDYQTEKQEAAALESPYGEDMQCLLPADTVDWAAIIGMVNTAKGAAQALHDLSGKDDILHHVCGDPALREALQTLQQNFPLLKMQRETFCTPLGITDVKTDDWFSDQLALCRDISTHAGELKDWMAYTAAANEAAAEGLFNVITAFEAGAAADTLLPAYRKALLRGLIASAIDESDTLSRFSGTVFNEKIEQYRRMDSEWTRLSQEEVYCRLASRIPNFTKEAAQSSELGILQRCIRSNGRGVSLRKLFDQIQNLLPRLCPCMLMSPISVAQYLEPGRAPFDIVVFDEASQLPTCKAIGALARGKNAVIVGDPKQMPPTSFFATTTSNEDDFEVEDLESILDDCLALNMPQTHLLWHYRSRHESLIAFSNHQFYENKLLTFPSVNERESKVRLVHVNGVFDRGKTRTNRAEAEAVIREIRRRYADAQLNRQSIGVVTFNIAQQHLIDDLLTEACAADPALEAWAYNHEEPLFIKNLENVQGDERDVILFSIGFGPDETGRIYMNFGPLNRDGGWRRLNVAVSRARCEMMVFSTLRPDLLDMNRTKSEGVAALRNFLDYASGHAPLADAPSESTADGDRKNIAAAICAALESKGYACDLSVGHSAYRVDIGVVDPAHPGRYLLGILLDSAAYSLAKTTRDREITQVGILRGLGWNILRIWCMDWWDNRNKELARIFDKLQALQTQSAADTAAAAPTPAPSTPPAKQTQPKPQPAAMASNAHPADSTPPRSMPQYKAAALSGRTLTAEEFIDPAHTQDIRRRIDTVMEAEAPISLTMLTRRVVQSCGLARAGSRIQERMNSILQSMQLRTSCQDGLLVYWKQTQNPDAYVGFRVNGEDENHRDVRDIPVQEVANAIYAVLDEQISMAQDDLIRETAKKLGYTRLGGNVLSALTAGIAYAEQLGGIQLGASGTFVLTSVGTARAAAEAQTL